MHTALLVITDTVLALHRCGEFFTGILTATAVCWWRWRWRASRPINPTQEPHHD